MTPATDAIIGAVPPDKFGVGSAVNDTTREIGGALGVAILGSLWQGEYAARVAGAAANLPAGPAQVVKASFAGAAAVAAQAGNQAGVPLLDAARDAFWAHGLDLPRRRSVRRRRSRGRGSLPARSGRPGKQR